MSNCFDAMGYVYICEDVSPEDTKPMNIQIYDKPNIFYVEFDATLQSFGVMNRNKRFYEMENVWDRIAHDEKIQDLLRNNGWFGEADHPAATYKGQELSPERILNPDVNNTSHKIMSPYCKGNLLNAKIQTDSGTAAGVNMAKKIIQGMTPRFSARAVAELINKNNRPTVVVKKMITYDWVLYPSHVEAHANDAPKVVSKTVETVNESAYDNITSITTILPLKEILQYAGAKDVNTQIIMESFALDKDSLIGLTQDNSHIILEDGKNRIYSKLDTKIRNEVTGYLSKM